MSSTNRLPFAALEERSRDLAPRLREGLDAIASEPRNHARFLNALSLAEHIGSRKIMASRTRAGFDSESLKHLAEETRHAFHFKRAAEKTAGRGLDYGVADMMAGASVRAYMGRLDAHITQALTGYARPLPYLYMSLIVELRAVWLYRIYRDVLEERKLGVSLAGVLAEEQQHLDTMQARVAELDGRHDEHVERFLGFEDERFRILWGAIEAEAAQPQLAAE